MSKWSEVYEKFSAIKMPKIKGIAILKNGIFENTFTFYVLVFLLSFLSKGRS